VNLPQINIKNYIFDIMNLAKHITDLLYRYDCVIVPDFGGFVTQQIGAKLTSDAQTFYPPAKQVAFNGHLKHNDGLLANYVTSTEKMSFEEAATAISLTVAKWQQALKTSEIQLDGLGILSLNKNQQIIFEPKKEINFLTASFGLSAVVSAAVNRPVVQVKQLIPIVTTERKKIIPTFIKYAATAAILLTISFAGYSGYEQDKQQEVLASQQKILEKKIQSATFVISNPLPTLKLNVIREVTKPYHVVAGAFQFKENANRKVKQLLADGFNSKIIGVNKWGLTQVSFDSYAEKNDAINHLNNIRRTVSQDAWLLVKTAK
jgi:nucleoid DNA-binding protein|tara:strand:+ start:2123 stop:3079 length:957 start_codon:yes stop_codon:yes gene_type:complete